MLKARVERKHRLPTWWRRSLDQHWGVVVVFPAPTQARVDAELPEIGNAAAKQAG
jgi:hypothetical protein